MTRVIYHCLCMQGRSYNQVINLVQSVDNDDERNKLIKDLIRVSTNMRKTKLVETLEQLLLS